MAGSPGSFKDHFSGHASQYARYRPTYPAELFDWLAAEAPARSLAWDAATGNGQAAVELAQRFDQVIATDGSRQQIDSATALDNIEYRVETAEHSSMPDRSADCITVAQAYHWFDHGAFIQELLRVGRPGAVFAAWTYALAEIGPAFDAVVRSFYSGQVGEYWPPERALVEQAYRGLEFPWPELKSPDLVLKLDWSLEDFLGYLRTWSAVQKYQQATGKDPVGNWEQRFSDAWGPAGKLTVSWPMRIRAFRITV